MKEGVAALSFPTEMVEELEEGDSFLGMDSLGRWKLSSQSFAHSLRVRSRVCTSTLVQWGVRLLLLVSLPLGFSLGALAVEGEGSISSKDWVRLDQARRVLEKSKRGLQLLDEASRVLHVDWNQLTEGDQASDPDSKKNSIAPGAISRTDSILNRGIDPQTGQESIQRSVHISLKVSQPLEDLVLDLAHELTHAARSQPVDPYDPTLTVERYLEHAILARGGEVDAVEMECRVGLDLAQQYGLSMKRCRKYEIPAEGPESASRGGVDREAILKDFGASGVYRNQIRSRLGDPSMKRMKWITDAAPELFSSTGRAPYPAALIDEYDALTDAACENSRKRVNLLLGASAPDRAPVHDDNRSAQAIRRAKLLLEGRCQNR